MRDMKDRVVVPSGSVPSGSAIALLRNRSLASAAQEEIERLILSGEIGSGAKLGEAEIAGRLGVSRGPVREAFRGLEEVGLIRFEKNRGVFVRKIELAEADQNYVVRGALEELAGKIVAQRITNEEIRGLRAIIKRMEKSVARKETASYVDQNIEFHLHIVELTHNSKLVEVYRKIVKELMLFRRQSLAPYETLDEHRNIADCIAARDSAAASQALQQHIEHARLRMLATYGPA
jgi:DNA-binding GntR family transcriptional regulator